MLIIYFLIIILLILLLVGFVIFILMEIIASFTVDAPFVPIPRGIEDEIVDSLELSDGSVLYDLGCGDARVLIRAVEKHPTIKAVGVEKAFVPYLLAKFRTRKYKNIEIKREDIFKTDLSDATHIFFYLFPGVPDKLIPIIKKQTQSKVVIMSCDFDARDTAPTKIVELKNSESKRGKKLFIYKI